MLDSWTELGRYPSLSKCMGMSNSDIKLVAEMPYKVVIYVLKMCGSDGGEMMLINADLITDSSCTFSVFCWLGHLYCMK